MTMFIDDSGHIPAMLEEYYGFWSDSTPERINDRVRELAKQSQMPDNSTNFWGELIVRDIIDRPAPPKIPEPPPTRFLRN